jgi:putative FmdB family regulatory protein
MPIYEFVCLDCGHDFERLQSFSDTTTPGCPTCNSVRVQRRLSPPAIHFKGSGWYVTDSKSGARNGKGSSEVKEKSAATESAPTADTKAGESAKDSTGKSEGGANTNGAAKSESASTKSATAGA